MDTQDVSDRIVVGRFAASGYNVDGEDLLRAKGYRLPYPGELHALAKTRNTTSAPPPRVAARPAPRPRTPRARRTRATARAGPKDDPSEPPPAPLDAQERRGLRILVDRAVRARNARVADWRVCPRCLREQEPEEFGNGCSYCRSCESARVSEAYHRRKALAA